MSSVQPATLSTSALDKHQGAPYSSLYGDLYHPPYGAWPQAQHIFLGGNQLPKRWSGREEFVVLETGFGLGNNFLATWSTWRADPARPRHLVFISIEKHPLGRADLLQVHMHPTPHPRAADHEELAQQLIDAWPPLTPGLHSLPLEHGPAGTVTLLLALGDVADLLGQVVARVDAFYLDGFSPALNPDMWDAHLLSRLGRLAAPGATAATWSSARTVREGLSRAGFTVERVPGLGGKLHMTVAHFAPHHQPAPLPGGLWPGPAEAERRHALIIGAGLAGSAAAWALSRQGWRCIVLDEHQEPAQGASGNPGGLFHSIVHRDDGIHARAHRAAALRTAALVRPWLQEGRLNGACEGLLRLDAQLDAREARGMLERLALPPEHVQWLERPAAQAAAGMAVPHGGWWFADGGWLHPAGYAHALLEEASRHATVSFKGGCAVHALRRTPDTASWQALGADGKVLAEAPVVVVANAHGAQALMRSVDGACSLPLDLSRGQVTALAQGTLEALNWVAPRVPVAGAGYLLPLHQRSCLCGATNQLGDTEQALRDADHRHNLEQAQLLQGGSPTLQSEWPAALLAQLEGRVGWRASTPDRLPFVGPWPLSLDRLALMRAQASGPRARLDQVRFVPRLRDAAGGIHVLTGLGSRGIAWAALAGDLLASWVTGRPAPVESALRDALDPARIVTRALAKTGLEKEKTQAGAP